MACSKSCQSLSIDHDSSVSQSNTIHCMHMHADADAGWRMHLPAMRAASSNAHAHTQYTSGCSCNACTTYLVHSSHKQHRRCNIY
mmetsp:Transcript_18360/g.46401  ORF Transcript_18360/g.46401 Transcript_18360/m.46401 type:complete len:85 (+) Transcript_18360:107-361(+)